jgi:hypothetical protein
MTALNNAAPPSTPRKRLSPQGATHSTSATAPPPRLRYIVVVLSGIFAILGIQLLLSIAVSGGAYEIAALKGEVRKSQQDLQMVAEDISSLTSPETLAGLATAMGMVADNNPAYLRLSNGEVIGDAQPAVPSDGSVMYSVTAGGEPVDQPAIVESVMSAVSQSVVSLGEPSSETPAAQAPPTTPMTTVSAPAPVPTAASEQASPPRFGGTIPAPITR